MTLVFGDDTSECGRCILFFHVLVEALLEGSQGEPVVPALLIALELEFEEDVDEFL